MDDVKRSELEQVIKETLKHHQREGLNMIGSVEQLGHRLVEAVEQWIEGEVRAERKSA
ncbi:MAG TPA: hypothetical protein VKW06_01160 [Candidatus Angelobacter sp.]|nr:hypothetical protein [Candidatus Angelobacter sp.]